MNRRGFVLSAISGFASLIAAGLGLPAFRYLLRAPEGSATTEWIDAGDLADIEPESPTELALIHRRTDGWKVVTERVGAWVVKDSSRRHHGVLAPLYALGLRLSMGGSQTRVHMPVPRIAFCHHRAGA